MKLASIIVTYHPNIEDVLRNIESFYENVDLFMLWDNSSPANLFDSLKIRFPNVIIHQDGQNHGLPLAYNWAIHIAQENNCTHLMTMDQDSIFEDFKEYRKQVETFNDSSVGIFTLPINHDIAQSGYIDRTVCQSGSIYTLDMLQRIGGFNEELFIGMVDAEMSLRVMEKGYKLYQITGCNLIHHVGSGRTIKILGKRIAISDYSPLRHYYDSRNRILLWHAYPYDYTIKHKINYLWGRIKLMGKIVLFETNKSTKIKAILYGTWNGFRNKKVPF